ncbi:MAG: sulfite reductase, assimilatory-type [Peptococcaceae bacterium BICA1-8]|nr:MAG: sulfite reductase, assimilatory-type [Peptococcaceae bacterium BICA1-8]
MADVAREGIIQRDKETYAIVPKTPMGILNPEILEKVAAVAKKYNIPIVKITSAQRLALVGIKKDDVEKVWDDLGLDVGYPVGACLHYVQSCPGTAVCRLGQRDSLGMAQKLDDFLSNTNLPAKTKVGVSGCPLNCGEGFVRDIGLFGKKDAGWTIIVGGNSGLNARIGSILAENLSDDEAFELIKSFAEYYNANAKPRERLYRFVPRIGIDEIKKELGL